MAKVRTALREGELAKTDTLNNILTGIYLRLEGMERDGVGAPGTPGATGPAGPSGTTGPAGAPPPGLDFGKFGSYADDVRVWGVESKSATNSTAVTVMGIAQSTPTGTPTTLAPSVASPRAWNAYYTSSVINNPAGLLGPVTLAAWVQRPRLQSLVVSVTVVTTRRIWVALASATLDQVSTDATKRYVGLRYDSAVSANWFVCTSDGTTASETDTGIAVAADTEYHVDIDFTDAASLSVKVNGAETTKATNLPSGTGVCGWFFTVTTLAASEARILWHHTMVSRK